MVDSLLRTLLLVLRAAIACSAGIATWLTLHYGLGTTAAGRPDESTMMVIVVLALSPIALTALARPIAARSWPHPSNIADLPPLPRQIAEEDGGWTEGMVPALVGIAIAGAVSVVTGPAILGLSLGTAVVAAGLAALIARADAKDRSRAEKLKQRVEQVRGGGTRVVAEVLQTQGTGNWRYGGPRITVTATFSTPEGQRTVVDDIVTEPADAPTPGGTVLVWYRGDAARQEDIYLEQDPDSIREPGAAERWAAPEAGS